MVEYLKFIAILVSFVLIGCSSSNPGNNPGGGDISVISVRPSQTSVKVGAQVSFSASAVDASGGRLSIDLFSWSSSNAEIAVVDADGVVTGAAPGEVQITATHEGFSGWAVLLVTEVEIVRIEIFPLLADGEAGTDIFAGEERQFTSKVFDADGVQVALSSPLWSSSDESMAVITAQGLLTGISPGVVVITASIGDITASRQVTVKSLPVASIEIFPAGPLIDVGGARQFGARVLDTAGAQVNGLDLVWSSSNLEVASISSTGLAIGLSGGDVVITAAFGETLSNPVTLRVVSSLSTGILASISLSPGAGSLNIGDTLLLVALPLDLDGVQLDAAGVEFSWSSSGEDIAAVDSSGLVSAAGEGTVTITVSSANVSAGVEISVTALPVAVVDVSPPDAEAGSGNYYTFVAVARNSLGEVVPGVKFTWSSSDIQIASVSSAGVATAKGAAGESVTISATASNGVSGNATFSIVSSGSGPLVEVTVTPAVLSLPVAGSFQFSALVSGSENKSVLWSVDGGEVNGSITETGFYTAPVVLPASARITVRVSAVADLSRSAVAEVDLLSRFEQISSFQSGQADPNSVVSADFNSDGKPDLAIAGNLLGKVAIFLGSGDGSFMQAQDVDLGLGSGFFTLFAGDLDRDSSVDIISANSFFDTVSVVYGDGTGSFSTPFSEQFLDMSLPRMAIAVDVDGGALDIITANVAGSLSILTGGAGRTFTGSTSIAFTERSTPFDLISADLDGDSQEEIIVVDLTGDKLYVLTPDLSGGLVLLQTLSLQTGAQPTSVTTGDFSGDGSLDVAVTNGQLNSVAIFLNSGSLLADTPTYFQVGSTPIDIAAGDFNQDGLIDLVTADKGSDGISMLFGKGDGTFQARTAFTTGQNPSSLVVLDLDSSGVLDDIVITNSADDNFTVFVNY